MKLTTMSFGRCVGCVGLAGLLFTFSGVASHFAVAQKLISYETTYHQQQSSAIPVNADLPVITPEFNADMLAAHQHYQEAIDAYKKITPLTADIYNKMGMAYQHLSMDEEAKYNYERAIKMDRKLAAAYNNLGTVYYHEKNDKQAEHIYRKSIKLDAKTAAFWSNIGAVYLANRKYRDGAEAYERAFTLDSSIFQEIALNGIREYASTEDMARMDYCFAEVYAQAGMKVEAVDYLRKAILEGFRDKQSLQQDQQFASLHGTPGFDRLFSNDKR